MSNLPDIKAFTEAHAIAECLLAKILLSRWAPQGNLAVLAASVQPAAFCQVLELHGMVGVLEHRHQQALLGFPVELLEQLHALRTRQLANALQQTGVVLRLMQGMDVEGIPCMVLKGVALSWQIYGDLAVRQSGDVDLLVDPSDVVQAANTLISLGAMAVQPLPADALLWREFMRSAHHLSFALPDRTPVELHWRSDPLASTSLLTLGRLWPLLDNFGAGPLKGLRCLPQAQLRSSLASHANRSRCTRWKWGYDLIELVSADTPQCPPWAPAGLALKAPVVKRTVQLMAAQWGASSRSMKVTERVVVRLVANAAKGEREQKMQHQLGGVSSRTFRSGVSQHLAAILALVTMRQRLAYGWWMLSRTSPDAMGGTYRWAARYPLMAPVLRCAVCLAVFVKPRVLKARE